MLWLSDKRNMSDYRIRLEGFFLLVLFSLSVFVWGFDVTSSFPIATGVWYTHIQTDTTGVLRNYNILKIDYTLPEVEFTLATATSGREETSSMAHRSNGLVAVNGGYFEWTGEHVGLLMHEGKVINGTYKMKPSRGAIGFGKNKKIVIDRVDYTDGKVTGLNGTDWSDITEIVSAGPILLRNGEIQPPWVDEELALSFSTSLHARTAIGITKDTTVVLVVIDGYQPSISNGISLGELSKYMQDLGCVNAMNLDGGGSSTMVIWDKVVNCVSDEVKPGLLGVERPVTNALVVRRKN